MAIEKIRLIKEAEAKAEQIRKDSRQESKEMISEAERQVASLLAETGKEMEDELKKVLAKAQMEAESEYEKVLAHAAEEARQSSAVAERNIEAAAAMIMGRVVN